MSTKAPILEIAPVHRSLPTCSPNLMPFHIAYSGPAPVSTYFHPKPAPAPTYAPTASTSTFSAPPENTLPTAAGDSQTSSDSTSTLVAAAGISPASTLACVENRAMDDAEGDEGGRYVAAFRGRTMQGLKVNLPDGYAGIVLRSPDEGQGESASTQKEQKARGKGKNKQTERSTRRSKRAMQTDAAESDIPAAEDMNFLDAHDETPIRRLEATSTFSSFTLWNPDIPVDEGKDEYLRSLTEWTTLAAEIHRFDE